MKKISRLFFTAMAICIFCSMQVFASNINEGDQNPNAGHGNGPCEQDRAEFCPDLQGQAFHQCMLSHKDQLSPACKEKIHQMMEQRENRNPCTKDVESLCSGVQRGGGRIIQCLKANEAQLSQQCKAAMAHPRQGQVQLGPGPGAPDRPGVPSAPPQPRNPQ